MPNEPISGNSLILAAEDFEPQEFHALHRFSANDERVIAKLIAHAPFFSKAVEVAAKVH